MSTLSRLVYILVGLSAITVLALSMRLMKASADVTSLTGAWREA